MLKFVVAVGLFAAAAMAQASEAPIHAEIHNASGAKIGEVSVHQAGKGVSFVISVKGLKPGMHGIHIHSVGKCEGPDFKSSGGHFALAGQHHGMENPQGPHLGDMPNLNVKKNGTAELRFHTDLLTLASGENSLKKPGGTALIIHEKADDQKSDPAGNAGGRIGCAVLSK